MSMSMRRGMDEWCEVGGMRNEDRGMMEVG